MKTYAVHYIYTENKRLRSKWKRIDARDREEAEKKLKAMVPTWVKVLKVVRKYD